MQGNYLTTTVSDDLKFVPTSSSNHDDPMLSFISLVQTIQMTLQLCRATLLFSLLSCR